MSHIPGRTVFKSFVALALSQYSVLAASMVFSLWLTRLLSPQDYGILAISLFYFAFFNGLAEAGWNEAFMAHKELDLHRAASTHLIVRCILGLLPLCTFLMVYPWVHSYVSADIYMVTLLLAGVYWIEKIGGTYRVILERSYQFERMAKVEFFFSVSSYATAVLAAWYGFGVFSLVIQRFVEMTGYTLGFCFLSPWKIGFAFDRDIFRTYVRSFGAPMVLSNFLSCAATSPWRYDFMPFIVGLVSGTYQAGLFNKALNLALVTMRFTSITSRLASPLYTNHQFDIPQVRNIFIKIQTLKFFLIVPGQIFVAMTAGYWIPYILGSQWSLMIPIYQVVAVYGVFRAFFDDVFPILLYGFKDPWQVTKNQAIQAVGILLLGPLFIMTGQAYGGALALVIVMGVATVLLWRVVCTKIDCGVKDFTAFIAEIPSLIKHFVWQSKEQS